MWASDTHVTNNRLHDNEFSVYVAGDDNRLTGNRTTSTIESQSTLGFRAWGMLLDGSGNHLAGNRLAADDGAAGIYVFEGSERNRITGNRIVGFEWPLFDDGDGTMVRGTPAPAN